MKYGILILCFLANFAFGQYFIPQNGGLKLSADKKGTQWLSQDEFDRCWCDSVLTKNDSTGAMELAYMVPKNEDKKRLLVSKNKLWGILDYRGQLKEPCTATDPFTYNAAGKKIVFKNFQEWGLSVQANKESSLTVLDDSGKVTKEYQVRDDYKGHFLASADGKRWGIMNGNTRLILKMNYDPARYDFTNFKFNASGLIPLETKTNDNKYGIVNYRGEILAGFRFDYIVDYIHNDDTIYAEINGKKGYINSRGGVLLPMRHTVLPEILTDSNKVATEKAVWFMDRNFKVIRDLKFQALEKKGDIYFYKKNGLWGIMDDSLNIIVKNQYYSIVDAPRVRGNNDFKAYVVVKNQKYGVISTKGEVIIPCKYNCNCTLGYFSPSGYFIEFSNAGTAYRFDENGEVISQGSDSGKACLCESYE